jgi:hypothetical protein
VDPQVVRCSERPELWEAISGLSDEVWPQYNQHGQTLNHYWEQLYDVFPPTGSSSSTTGLVKEPAGGSATCAFTGRIVACAR